MKTKKMVFLLVVLLITTIAFAQTITPGTNEKINNNAHGAQALYGELGGNGLLFSANYDFRFTKSQKGFGMRMGLGFFGGTGGGIFTIPIGINHLAGKAPNYFESGIGLTYGSYTGDDFLSGSNGFILVPSIGYRYQPEHSGFFARFAVSPLIGLQKNGGWIFWGGVGIGYKF